MAKTNTSSLICIVKLFPLLDRFYWLCYSLSGNSFPSNISITKYFFRLAWNALLLKILNMKIVYRFQAVMLMISFR